MPAPIRLRTQPLTAEAFKPYGDVIEAKTASSGSIPSGTALRFDDLANVEVGLDGNVCVNILQTTEVAALPSQPRFLECHPLGSQAFIPIEPASLIIVVGVPAEQPDLTGLQAFLSDGRQGVNYKPGVWHLPLSSLAPTTFLMIERKGPGLNLRKYDLLDESLRIET